MGEYTSERLNEEKKLTEEEVRAEYKLQRKDKIFRKCWPANNDSFYEWCSQYLDYQHITKKKKSKNIWQKFLNVIRK